MIMGKIFSKPMATTPSPIDGPRGPDNFETHHIQGNMPNRSNPSQQELALRRPIRGVNMHTIPSSTTSGFDRSPRSVDFGGHDQDASTINDHGRSPTSPHQPRRTRGFSLDSSFSEIHHETRKEVFRKGSFGEKTAVQILCKDLLKIMQPSVASSPMAPDNATLLSSSSWIMEPYELIFHNKVNIERHPSARKAGDASKHLAMFLEFLEDDQPGAWAKYDEVQSHSCQQILFRHLWMLYSPRTTVFSTDDGVWRAYVVEKSEMVTEAMTTVLRVHTWYLDFNKTGDRLIPHEEIFDVPSYLSEQSIRMLKLIPKWFLNPESSFYQKLESRGQKHWKYNTRPWYQNYTGTAWPSGPGNSPLKVIVDYSTSTRCAVPGNGNGGQNSSSCCSVCIGESFGLFSHPRVTSSDDHACINSKVFPFVAKYDESEDEDGPFIYCPPKLWAFFLRFKTWALVAHDDLDIVQPDASFEKELYMDSERKRFLDQIVSAYMSDRKFIGNDESLGKKGRGLNILLVGSSGTGKTFTAECLSRKYGVPLYAVSCGDLGVQSDVMDRKLLETFTRAMNWNAMVLLDDIDIYCYDRAGYAYKRSALLPTFLRHLEYSECLTFISAAFGGKTNVDGALQSRIHAVVPFPRFNFGSQIQIWERFIRSLPSNLVDTSLLISFIRNELSDLDGGKHMQMNAWQIRNCIDVALALARKDTTTERFLQPDHIKTVLKLGEAFRAHVLQEKREIAQVAPANLSNNSGNPFAVSSPSQPIFYLD